jgi:hypothetical protein
MAIDDRPQQPLVGSWYEDLRNRRYEVVAYDEDTGLLAVQYFDGSVSEFELGDWQETVLAEIAPPENLGGAFDDLTADDFGDTERPRRPEDWDGPWNEIDNDK